jgi:hypothetical protein
MISFLRASLYSCKKKFKDELDLLLHKASRKSYINLKGWVERFRYMVSCFFLLGLEA